MTEQGFLADILNNPSDDAPRLVYADFLDEQGRGERAEFIRVQCKLADGSLDPLQRKPAGIGGYRIPRAEATRRKTKRLALRRRERELLGADSGLRRDDGCNTNKVAWSGDLTLWCQEIDFRRGFVHAITCTAADCLQHLDTILAVQPVQEVTLTTWPGWAMDASAENTEKNLRHNWPQIKKWTLPPQYNVGPLVDAALAEEDDPYGICFCGAKLNSDGHCSRYHRHTA